MKKRIILIFLSILILLSTFTYVQAEEGIMPLADTTEEGLCYRYIINKGYNTEKSGYEIQYDVYTHRGRQEGTVYVPSEYYDLDHWFLFLWGDVICIATNSKSVSSSDTVYCTFEHFDSTRWSLGYYKNNASTNNWLGYKCYSFKNDTWSLFNQGDYNLYVTKEGVSINSIIYSKNVDIKYGGSVSSSKAYDWQELKTPDMKLVQGTGFRVYLNNFHGATIIDDETEIINSLTNLYLYVYDFNNKGYLTEELDLLGLSEVHQDDEGNYYYDILFDTLSYMNKVNGDYLVSVVPFLSSTKHFTSLSTTYDVITKYQPVCYWRYQYYSSSGTGMLVPTDSEGNPINPDEPQPELPDPTIEAIGGLNNSISEQTNVIKDQTNAIKEQTETNKNIFQQIIELPRENSARLFGYA